MTATFLTPAVLTGLAIGDALGMPFESNTDKVHPGLATWYGTYEPGTYHKLPAGHWTDDTEMAVALTHSLLETKGVYDGARTAAQYLAWMEGTPHGSGGTTRQAMQNLKNGADWEHSGVHLPVPEEVGSGPPMRIAPLGVVLRAFERPEPLQLLHDAIRDAAITHVSNEAYAASGAVAFAVSDMLSNPQQPGAHWAASQMGSVLSYLTMAPGLSGTRLREVLLQTIPWLKKGRRPEGVIEELGRRGNVLQLVPTALYCAFSAFSFAEGVQAAVRGGGDTDTRGAITGAILGARFGYEGIPIYYKTNGLLQLDLIRELDTKLLDLRRP